MGIRPKGRPAPAPRPILLVLAFCLAAIAGLAWSAPGQAAPTPPIDTWTQQTPQSPAGSPPAREEVSMAYDATTGQIVLFGGRGESGLLDDTWTWDGASWTKQVQQSSGTGPPAREGASMAYDAATGQMVLFGGRGESGLLDDTWTWDGASWTKQVQQSSGTGPLARAGASMAYDAATGQIVLFGGVGESGRFNDTWIWDGNSWTRQAPANIPPARFGASMAYDPATRQIVLFGGAGNSGSFEDTWTWDGTTWTRQPQQSPGTGPPARYRASMAYDPAIGRMILFGGGDALFLKGTWSWDGTTWTELSVTGPPVRVGGAMVHDPATGRLVLFGGVGESGRFDDTWTFGPPPGVSSDWTELAPPTGAPAREAALTAYDPAVGRIVLFGGIDEGRHLRNDTWTWDGTTWTQASPTASPPLRDGASMAYDPATGQIVLFGGVDEGHDFRNDTWTWDGTTWTQASPQTSPPVRDRAAMAFDPAIGEMVLFGGLSQTGELDDTWTWDGTTWTQRSSTAGPPVRFDASMAYDAASGRMVLFGGSGQTGELDDTWTWDGTTWTQASPTTRPAARSDASMAYDPAIGRMVLFGGFGEGDYLDDTWTWDGTTWTRQFPETSPPSRADASMAYDPAIGRIVIFGGLDRSAIRGDTWTYQPTVAHPDAAISSPAGGQTYTVGQAVTTAFSCSEAVGGPGIKACTDSDGTVSEHGSLDTSTVGPHTYTVTAESEDGEVGEASIDYEVTKATPGLSAEASGPVPFGGQIADTATVSGGSGPGGTIVFRAYGPEDATCSGTPAYTSSAVPVAGESSYASTPDFTPTAVGTYRWVAEYSGDDDNEAATSDCAAAGQSVTVDRAPSTTSLVATPDPAVFGDGVTITGKVTGAAPTGTVTFSDGDATLGTANLTADGTASITTTGLGVGPHRLNASYSGNADNEPSASAIVEEAITAPPPPSPGVEAPAPPTPPAPSVRISYSPNEPHSPNPKGGPRYTFRFADVAPGTTFYCRLDKGPFKPCRSPQVYRHLRRGRHLFEVKSIDSAGVESAIRRVSFTAGRHRQ